MIIPKNINVNTIYGVFAILLWSTTVGLFRSISEQIGPLTAGAYVYLIGGLILVCKLFLKKCYINKLAELSSRYLFVCGLLFMIYTITFFLSLGLSVNREQSIEVALINYLWPIITLLFSIFILLKNFKIGLFPGTILAILGIVLVITHGSSISWTIFIEHISVKPIVYILAFIAAISWALYSNLTRYWAISDSIGAVPVFILFTGFALLILHMLYPERKIFWNLSILTEMTFFCLSTIYSYVLWDISMRKGNVVIVISFSYLTPLLSTLVSCIYLGIMPGIRLWLGCLFIMSGSFLSWRSIY